MNYYKINKYDVANGVGIRTSLFVSGCNIHCKGCFNQDTWDFDSGKTFTNDTMNEILNYLGDINVTGLSILGGEPLDINNIATVLSIIKTVKSKYPNKDIWLWTGYYIDNIKSNEYVIEILKYVDMIVEGPYIESLRDLNLNWRGSSNQIIRNIKKEKLI